MQNPIGLFLCSDPKEKYNRIEIFEHSQVVIGLNDFGAIEILQDYIRFNLALLEHKFNSFIVQSLSDCCQYRGNQIQRHVIVGILIGVCKPSASKNKDSKIKRMIQADNCFLENTLKCAICLEILQKPVQLQCKHCFCGHCITRLLNSFQLKCPTCRSDVTQISNVPVLNKLSQQYLRKYPEKAKSIEQQQLYEQQTLVQYFQPRNKQNINLPDEIVQQQQQEIQAECKSCQNQYQDFICQPDQQHVQCCNYWLPRRQLNEIENAQYKMFCQICKQYTCRYYYSNNEFISNQICDLRRWSQDMYQFSQILMSESMIIKNPY